MKYANRLSFWSLCFIILSILLLVVVSCNNGSNANGEKEGFTESGSPDSLFYTEFLSSAQPELIDGWLVEIATYVLRKPDAATWQTKFNPEFRNYYEKLSNDLEWIYAREKQDTTFFFLIRDGRDNNGRANRGVGGKLVFNEANEIQHFEELFVTKITDRINLESIGKRFMMSIEEGSNLNSYIQNQNNLVEWPDGRLFYSVEKSEWRYVD